MGRSEVLHLYYISATDDQGEAHNSTAMSNVHGPAFAGLLAILNPTNTPNLQQDVVDDMEGEQETLPDLTADDFDLAQDNSEAANSVVSQWRDSITGASKRVTEKTHSEYQK